MSDKNSAAKEYSDKYSLIRDKYHELTQEKDQEFEAAVRRFLRVLVRQGAYFSSPGPGSPPRWIIHSVMMFCYPEYPRHGSYEPPVMNEEYLECLKELAKFFERDFPD